jgi:hypothetical protein
MVMLSRMESPLLSARSPCQKNDPATSPCDDAPSSIEMSGILPDTDAPANLVHGAMGTGPVVVFGQGPQSLSSRKRRGQPVVPGTSIALRVVLT